MEAQAIQIMPELLELLKKDGVTVPQENTQTTQSKPTTACNNKKQKAKIKKAKIKKAKTTKKASKQNTHAIGDTQANTKADDYGYDDEEKLLLAAMKGEKPFANAVLKSFFRNKHGRVLLATIKYDTDRLLHLIEDAVEASPNADDLIAYENAKTVAILIDRVLHRLPHFPADWQILANRYGEDGIDSHLIPQDDYKAKRAVALIKLTTQTHEITDDTYSTPLSPLSFDDETPEPTLVDHIKATIYAALYGNINRMIYTTLNHAFRKYEASSGTIWDKALKRKRAKTAREFVWVTEHSITYGTDDGENATLLAKIESPYHADDILTLRRRAYIEQLQDETVKQVETLLRKAKKAGISEYKKKNEIDYIKSLYELKLNEVNFI